MRSGFLDINILARLRRPDGAERVPMVRRGKRDYVDVLIVQKLPDIGIAFDGVPGVVRLLNSCTQNGAVHIT